MNKREIKTFIKNSVKWLIDNDYGCCTYRLDDRLAICIGWINGYDENDVMIIHSKDDKRYALNIGLKVYTSDYLLTDYEYINNPYYENGYVLETDITLSKQDIRNDYKDVIDYLTNLYNDIKHLDINEDGLINEKR